MKILAIGDIVGTKSIDYLKSKLWGVRDRYGIDLTVANGENASDIHGLSASDATAILDAGVDVITLGNHSFGKRDLYSRLGDCDNIIRPANYPPLAPGGGYTTVNVDGWKVLCINVLGTALMEPLACPFATVEKILERESGDYDVALLDIHAETTSEKLALARYFDGKIQVIFGTHTHVTTADEQILPRGSGYITDLGMTGPTNGIIGTDADVIIEKFRTKMPARFRVADGEIVASAAIFTVDTSRAVPRAVSVERIKF